VPGVFLGYEPGTKGYQVYDPIKDKLMVSHDVIFVEKTAWNWEGKGSRPRGESAAPETFSVQCFDDTVPGPIIGPDADDGAFSDSDNGEPTSPAVSIPSLGMHRLHIHHHITRFNGQLHPQVLLKILKVCHFDTEPSPICLTQQMRCRGSSIVDCVWLQLKNQILLMKHFLKIVGGGLWRWR